MAGRQGLVGLCNWALHSRPLAHFPHPFLLGLSSVSLRPPSSSALTIPGIKTIGPDICSQHSGRAVLNLGFLNLRTGLVPRVKAGE
ncbi:hypothetical protein LshimejAT787_0606140 [Lyophyllum shimeji]|uniref:Uncharacterized protein n=1 Tax=Lyophyllum shimeji TaxID=47721 RepID=A0A9P3PQC1_LYOSH|nr:hypothetical protein LshimejAT787_0606140 [Lyophyllum shimeji]